MSNAHPTPVQQEAALPPLGRRVAVFVALFSAMFLGLLLASRILLVPRFAQLNVGGSVIAVDDVPGLAERKERELKALESERDAFVLPGRDARYLALRDGKFAMPPLAAVRSAVRETALAVGGQPGVVAVSVITLDVTAKTLVLDGEVRTTDPGSMTMLARFVEELEHLPFVASLTPPSFSREETDDGFRSPFTITMTLSPL